MVMSPRKSIDTGCTPKSLLTNPTHDAHNMTGTSKCHLLQIKFANYVPKFDFACVNHYERKSTRSYLHAKLAPTLPQR